VASDAVFIVGVAVLLDFVPNGNPHPRDAKTMIAMMIETFFTVNPPVVIDGVSISVAMFL
jgi:hypothetical protein